MRSVAAWWRLGIACGRSLASAPVAGPPTPEAVSVLLREAQSSADQLRSVADWPALRAELATLEGQLEAPDLWSNAKQASALSRRAGELKAKLTEMTRLTASVSDYSELASLALADRDDDLLAEVADGLSKLVTETQACAFRGCMSGDADPLGCFVEVRSGAGGVESMDWTQMLARMYSRWAESRSFEVELADSQAGEQAGLRHAVLQLRGAYAYGWLKHEAGVHRLVRMSPFDAAGKRHTSFASVNVQPLIEESGDLEQEIDPSQIRIDVYRASGAGGQHVNKTESAVRITHIPTGIVVTCQNDRSQHRNRRIAMAMLRARLYELEQEKQRARLVAQNAALPSTSFGSQIRSYVMQPYQLVKDSRTGVEHGNPEAVLDGDLDRFLQAAVFAKGGKV